MMQQWDTCWLFVDLRKSLPHEFSQSGHTGIVKELPADQGRLCWVVSRASQPHLTPKQTGESLQPQGWQQLQSGDAGELGGYRTRFVKRCFFLMIESDRGSLDCEDSVSVCFCYFSTVFFHFRIWFILHLKQNVVRRQFSDNVSFLFLRLRSPVLWSVFLCFVSFVFHGSLEQCFKSRKSTFLRLWRATSSNQKGVVEEIPPDSRLSKCTPSQRSVAMQSCSYGADLSNSSCCTQRRRWNRANIAGRRCWSRWDFQWIDCLEPSREGEWKWISHRGPSSTPRSSQTAMSPAVSARNNRYGVLAPFTWMFQTCRAVRFWEAFGGPFQWYDMQLLVEGWGTQVPYLFSSCVSGRFLQNFTLSLHELSKEKVSV